MIQLELINQRTLPKRDEYLWRYIDIHKLLRFISQRTIRFNRLDQFEDPLEGVSSEILERINRLNINPVSLANHILEPNKLLLLNGMSNKGRLEEIIQRQKSHFVSCWFFGKRESMAMWNSYSNPDGVALKVPFEKLKVLLKPNEIEDNVIEYFCGKVMYRDFYNTGQSSKNKGSRLVNELLRKDLSFSHENEIRFVVKRKQKIDDLIFGIESRQMDLRKLGVKVVCHPRMDNWKKENIKELLSEKKLLSIYSESEIKLRF